MFLDIDIDIDQVGFWTYGDSGDCFWILARRVSQYDLVRGTTKCFSDLSVSSNIKENRFNNTWYEEFMTG